MHRNGSPYLKCVKIDTAGADTLQAGVAGRTLYLNSISASGTGSFGSTNAVAFKIGDNQVALLRLTEEQQSVQFHFPDGTPINGAQGEALTYILESSEEIFLTITGFWDVP